MPEMSRKGCVCDAVKQGEDLVSFSSREASSRPSVEDLMFICSLKKNNKKLFKTHSVLQTVLEPRGSSAAKVITQGDPDSRWVG